MTTYLLRSRGAIAAALAAAMLTACSSGQHSSGPGSLPDANLLAGCGPIPTTSIAAMVHAATMARQTTSEICAWTSVPVSAPDDSHAVDVTYAWLPNSTLHREADVATRLGYRVQHLVVSRAGGFSWRDPRDPGSCAVSAFDAGTVTWWVQNRSHTAQPDPCGAALALATATMHLDG